MAANFVTMDGIEEIVEPVRRRFALKPKVAFAGFGKAGKSSLMNAIYGSEVARVSMRTDETREAQVAERFGIDFTDTPGIGTSQFSLDKVLESGVLDRQHVVVHVLNGASAVTHDDERLHEALGCGSAKAITVVNKVDLLDPAERQEYRQSVGAKLGLIGSDVVMVSAKRGEGVPELVGRIVQLLPEAMQDAFIGQQRADAALKARRVRAVIYSKASVCAAVALAPIPVADIFVMTPIQVAMITTIGYLHGVEITAERAGELFAVVGAGAGLRETARQVIKMVPGYGSAISAAIAFAGTVALGEAAHLWFSRKMRVDAAELRALFLHKAEQARQSFQRAGAEPSASPAATRARVSEPEKIASRVRALSERLARGELTEQEYERALASLDDGNERS